MRIYKYIEIGRRIRHLRGPDTQTEFANKLGMTLRSYQRYESGERMPKGDIAQRIAAFRGHPVDFILHGEPSKFTLEEAREHAKYAMWLEDKTLDEKSLEKLARQYLKNINSPEYLKGVKSSTKPASMVDKTHVDYNDDLTKRILGLLHEMNKEQKRQVLRFIEGQNLLAEREKK